MTIIWFLMPIAFGLAGFFVFLFIWIIKEGQYDDLDTPSYRVLLDDERAGYSADKTPDKGHKALDNLKDDLEITK